MSNKSVEREETADAPKTKSVVREYTEAILLAFILAMFIRTFAVQAFKIPSGSMKETLLIGDHILVTKFSYGVHLPNEIIGTSIQLFEDHILFMSEPKRYDVIVFKFPKDESKDFIKRVIGLPGETLEIRFQQVYIDGKKIDDPFANHTEAPDGQNPRDNFGPVRIPEGHLFVMGDNRENSQDSRFWGFLDIKKIRGKAQMIYFSKVPAHEKCFFCGDVRWSRFGQSIE